MKEGLTGFMKALLQDIKNANWAQRFVWANVVLFLTLALAVPKAASTTLFLLFVSGVVMVVRQGWPKDMNRWEKLLLLVFGFYFAVGVLSYILGIQTRLGWEIIFRDIRFLFAIPAYLAIRHYPPPRRLVWLALPVAGFAMLGGGLADYLGKTGGWRASGSTIAIVFGHLGVTVALACVAGVLFLRGRFERVLAMAGFIAAVAAIMLSGTRGAWLSLLVLGGALLLLWWRQVAWRQRMLSVAAAGILAAAAGFLLYKPLVSRMNEAVDQWHSYQAANTRLAEFENSTTGCINHAAFLEFYAGQFRRSKRDLTQIDVIKDPAIAEHGCPAGSVIRLRNTGDRSDWLTTPRRAIAESENAPARAVWLVRGKGAVQFGGTRDSRTPIDSESYRRFELAHPQARWPTVATFILRKGESLYLAPIQIVPGEYTLLHASSSVGSRLQMWRAAGRVFTAQPLLGAGTGAWRESMAPLIQSGTVSAIVARYDHPHNDYLTVMADRGSFGLLSLLLLYGAPLGLFVSALRRAPADAPDPAAVAGLLLVGGFMVSGLTETLFNHSLGVTYYALFASVLAALCVSPNDDSVKD